MAIPIVFVNRQMLRALDKQNEAAFFLEKAINAFFDEDQNWRYYFNALVSAARSISFVLQKDLRPFYGKDFDDWWDEQKRTVFEPVNFGRIRDMRNILEKEGAKFPLMVLEVELSNCIFKVVRIEVDQSLGTKGIKYRKFELSKEQHEIPDIPGETPEQLQERVSQYIRELYRTGFKEFWAHWQNSEIILVGFCLPGSEDVVDLETMLKEFSLYLRAMAQVLRNAQARFCDLPELVANSCGCDHISSGDDVSGRSDN